MPDFSMFGPAESGGRLLEQDMQKQQMNDLAMQQDRQNLAEGNNKIELQKLQLQQQAMQTQRMQQQYAQDEKDKAAALDILQKNQTATASQLGELFIHAGLFDLGDKVLKVSSDAAYKIADADKMKQQADETTLRRKLSQTDQMMSMLKDTHSQDDYDKAVKFYEQSTGETVPDSLKNLKWDDTIKQKFTDFGNSARERLQNELASKSSAKYVSPEDVKQKQELQKVRIEEAKQRIQKIQAETKQKLAGTPAERKEYLNEAKNIIKQQFPKSEMDDPRMENAASYIAEKARDLLAKNKGLDKVTALNQAFLTEMKNGDIFPEMKSTWGGFGKDEPSGKVGFKLKDQQSNQDNKPSAQAAPQTKTEAKAPAKTFNINGQQEEARQAPDGKYYVQKDGKYYEVVP